MARDHAPPNLRKGEVIFHDQDSQMASYGCFFISRRFFRSWIFCWYFEFKSPPRLQHKSWREQMDLALNRKCGDVIEVWPFDTGWAVFVLKGPNRYGLTRGKDYLKKELKMFQKHPEKWKLPPVKPELSPAGPPAQQE